MLRFHVRLMLMLRNLRAVARSRGRVRLCGAAGEEGPHNINASAVHHARALAAPNQALI